MTTIIVNEVMCAVLRFAAAAWADNIWSWVKRKPFGALFVRAAMHVDVSILNALPII